MKKYIAYLFVFICILLTAFQVSGKNLQNEKDTNQLNVPCIYFDDINNINNETKKQLNAIAKSLQKLNVIVEVRGHTDVRGPLAYNQRLSEKRAKVVKDYLIKKGVNGDKIIAKGYGERFPLCTEQTEECHALNRRADILILGWK